MSSTLLGKLAFVTGAGSGIGRATCKILAREGASIIAADLNVKNVEETVNNIPKNSDQSHIYLNLDVSQKADVNQALKKVLDVYKKPPTVIVNAAGITRDNFLSKLSEEDFDQVINVNLKGSFLVLQTFTNAMLEQGLTGSVINISSIVGKYGNIGQVNYGASKAGVIMMTKTAAMELGRSNIRVNCILPGFIVTPMTDAVPDKVKAIFLKKIALQRLGQPEEIAEAIAFLASDKSSYISGTAIEVAGGFN